MTERDNSQSAVLGLGIVAIVLVAAFANTIKVDFVTSADVLWRLVGTVATFVMIGVVRRDQPLFGLPIFVPGLLSFLAVAIFPALDYWSAHYTFGFSLSDVAWFDTMWFKLALSLTPLSYYAVKLFRLIR